MDIGHYVPDDAGADDVDGNNTATQDVRTGDVWRPSTDDDWADGAAAVERTLSMPLTYAWWAL